LTTKFSTIFGSTTRPREKPSSNPTAKHAILGAVYLSFYATLSGKSFPIAA
jgi:hypothetical protein